MIDGHTAGRQSRKVTLAPTAINTGKDGRKRSERAKGRGRKWKVRDKMPRGLDGKRKQGF